MIKNLFIIASMLASSCFYAQNLDIKDDANNSINGRTHYIYNSGPNMASTKFHVGNSSVSPIDFNCTVWEIVNPTQSEWQVCFGVACYIASFNVPTGQTFSYATSPAGGIYSDLKIAPFSFGWVAGDYGVWRVKVYDKNNISDTSSCYIVWTVAGSPCGDQDHNTLIDGTEIAGDLNLNGVIDNGELTGDMNGNGTIDAWEVHGDSNGNGTIDGAEVMSTFEYFDNNNLMFKAYPNPVSDQLTINYNVETKSGNARIEVVDILGQPIDSYQLNDPKGKLSINTNKYNSGIYFYTIKIGEKAIKTERIIIK